MPLQIRRGTNAERVAMTQPLAQGELLYVTDTQRIYVGNGSTLGGIAVTGYTNADARDAAASIFTSGSHNGINFSYNTATDVMTATVDLSNYSGTINASSFKGSLVADDSTLLIDAIDGKINLDGTVKGNVVPNANGAYDIGSNSFRFKDLYLNGSTITLGSASITASGSVVNLPAGSTIGGLPIAMPGGDINANVVANDSTVIVNTTTEVVTAQGGFVGNLLGNVSGNVTGDVSGNLSGNVTGNVTGNLTGNSTGYHTGDVKGSVFADDSTMLVDATNGVLNGSAISDIITGRVSINRDTDTGFGIVMTAITSDGDSGSGIDFQASKGTVDSPTDITDLDRIFALSGRAWKADQSDYVISAIFAATVDGTYGAGDPYVPSKFNWYTTNGTNDPFTAGLDMSFDKVGKLSAPTIQARKSFNLPVFADTAARDSAVPSPTPGMMVFITGTGMQVRGATTWNTIAGTA